MTARDDTVNSRTDGDDLIIETAFGEARFSLKDGNRDATKQLRGDREWPDDLGLSERWEILLTEIADVGVPRYLKGEL